MLWWGSPIAMSIMIKAIVTDIEGTTSSLAFVKDVLFPYARAHLGDFVRTHGAEPEVAKLLEAVADEAGRPLSGTETIAQLERWMAEDRKITPLKTLQGLIWEQGYGKGELKGHVYADAVKNLRRWKNLGIALYVYSSGSVHAQKLLFGYSQYGDLTKVFSSYFDTTVGMKREAASYRKIVAALGLPAQNILFLSDIKEELDAAAAAGMQTGWLVRHGALPTDASHIVASNFDDIASHFLESR